MFLFAFQFSIYEKEKMRKIMEFQFEMKKTRSERNCVYGKDRAEFTLLFFTEYMNYLKLMYVVVIGNVVIKLII